VADPTLALDLDLAIAQRCHQAEQESLTALLADDDQGGFFSAVIALLNRR